MPIQEVTSTIEFYDQIIKSNHKKKYIFCDFYATWCNPCKKFLPKLTEFSNKYNKNIHYIKVNISNELFKDILDEYNICSVPTFIIFESGSLELKYDPIIGADSNKIEKTLQLLD